MEINPMAAGLSKSRLERITDHLQRNFIDTGKLPGCQTLVARKGVIGYFSSLGHADLDAQTPVQDDTIFPHLFNEQAGDVGGAYAVIRAGTVSTQ